MASEGRRQRLQGLSKHGRAFLLCSLAESALLLGLCAVTGSGAAVMVAASASLGGISLWLWPALAVPARD